MQKMSEIELDALRDELEELKGLYSEKERIDHEIHMLRSRVSKLVSFSKETVQLNAVFTECEIDPESLEPL